MRTKFNYKIYVLNFPSGKKYVGMTKRQLSVRLQTHISLANSGKIRPVSNAIRKYKNRVTIELLSEANSRVEAQKLEKHYIMELNTLVPNGYNFTKNGCGGVAGKKHTKEFKENLSKIKTEFYSITKNREDQSTRVKNTYSTKEGRKLQSDRALLQNNPVIKSKIKTILKTLRSTKEYRENKRVEQKKVWSNPELRKKHSEIMKAVQLRKKLNKHGLNYII